MLSHIVLDINIAPAMGAYSIKIFVGSNRTELNVLLDTGSSTLAIDLNKYCPQNDQDLAATTFAQCVVYGSGGWAGPVIRTDIGLDHSSDLRLENAPIAILENQQQQNFQQADGIWGLAYHHLNKSFDVTKYLQQMKPPNNKTFPWPFDIENNPGAIAEFKKFLKTYLEQDITPLFSAFEEAKITPNQFTFITHRSIKHVPRKGMSMLEVTAESLNQGQFIIGDYPLNPEKLSAKVVHDAYYNVILKSVRVAGFEPVNAPPLDAKHEHNFFSNAIVDSGSSFMMLQRNIYLYVLGCFDEINPELRTCINAFNQQWKLSQDYQNAEFDITLWPDIYFTLEGIDGHEIELKCSAQHYWQSNAQGPDNWFFLLMDQLEKWPDQTILGLPLMNGYVCTFDRSSNHHLGLIHFG